MFAGMALLCFVTTSVSIEPWLEKHVLSDADEVPVTIMIDGKTARDYVRMIKHPIGPELLQKKGVVQINGMLVSTENSGFRVRHVAIIKTIGEPLQLLVLESPLKLNEVVNNPGALNEPESQAAKNSVQLTDQHQVKMTLRKLVGGFPDSARYQ
jgi:hypothetical protein